MTGEPSILSVLVGYVCVAGLLIVACVLWRLFAGPEDES